MGTSFTQAFNVLRYSFIVLVVFFSPISHGDHTTFKFRGTVNYVSPEISSVFSPGQSLSGSYTFDTNTDGNGSYLEPFSSARIRLDSFQWDLDESPTISLPNAISIIDSNVDIYDVQIIPDGPSINRYDLERFGIVVWDDSRTMFNNSLLPSTPPDISSIPEGNRYFSFNFENGEWISGTLTSLTFSSTVSSCELDGAGFIDSVEVLPPSGPRMRASFIPSNGCTLDEVADAMGYDHFNWVQVINHYDGDLYSIPGELAHIPPLFDKTPFIDPPNGGYLLRPADFLPYYWDEMPDLELGYHLDDNRGDGYLNINDTPRSSDIDQVDEYMGFTTSLVGVVRGSVWIPEFTFEWKSNYNGDAGDVTLGRDISPPNGGEGGIFDVQVLADPLAVDPDVENLWIKYGSFDQIPLSVDIDIKPGSDQNCFNVNGHGVIPVAVLGSEELDVTYINPETLLFGGLAIHIKNNGHPHCSLEDVNNDDFWDLVCKFEDEDNMWWDSVEGEVLLRGELYDRTEFAGTDSICIVPFK